LNNGESQGGLPGSGWIEVVLWLCYIVPGLIYSIWRRGKKNVTCSACASRDLIQVGTPVGAQLARQYHPQAIIAESGSLLPPEAKKAPPPSAARIFKTIGLLLLAIFVIAFISGVISRM